MQKKELFRIRFSREKDLASVAAHSEIEIIYVLEGTVDIQVEQKLSHLKKDDILVINPDRRRSVPYAESPLLMHLLIDYAMVRDTMQGQDIIFWCDSSTDKHEKYNELRTLLKRLIRRYIQSDKYETTFSFLSDCYEILAYLNFDFMVKAADVQWSEEEDRFEERLFKINNYINSNYDQPISIKDLSEKLYLSIGYLSRFFKKNYGMNFANYLTNVRLVHATDELLYTNTSVTRVAYDCGFTSAAIFNKAFKKVYNMTPTEFRKQAEGEEKPEIALSGQEELDARIEQIVAEDIRTDDIGKDIRTKTVSFSGSVKESVPLRNYWGDTINFGEAENLLSSSMREHLVKLHQILGFQYVRFWSIFSRDMYIRPDQDNYDFSRIDSILDFILEQGMKPFIELGMKPKTLHFEIGFSQREQLGDEFSCQQWEKLMHRFMRHLERRYGADTLCGWRMELWFDEDLRDDPQEWDQYLEKFRITYQEIKALNTSIQMGGYGIRIDQGGPARVRFLQRWKETCPLPDFISIMLYAYERGPDGKDVNSRRSTDDELFIHLLTIEKERLKSIGLEDIPIYICEWNMTPSVRNIMNDTCYKGCYIIRNILDLYGEVQAMGFGAGSDRQYSYYDTAEMLFGGTGLISKDGIKKPAAFALNFMNELKPRIIGKGTNYIITTDDYHSYAILCHNQQKLNESYFLTPETKIQKEALWKYFDNMYHLRINITLQDVEEGTYRINCLRVNKNYGSALNIWEGLSFEKDLSREELRFMKQICEPYIFLHKQNTVGENLLIQEELEPNEFVLFLISHQKEPE